MAGKKILCTWELASRMEEHAVVRKEAVCWGEFSSCNFFFLMVTTVAPNFALGMYMNIQMYVYNTYNMSYYITCSSVRNDFLVLV